MAQAVANDNIWVAEGTYTPGSARTDVFTIDENVRLYGGFTNGMNALGERDWVAYPTFLSGEIGTPAVTDNCYRVVIANGQGAILDGFTITRGYGADKGAGLYCGTEIYRGMKIQNCVFEDNWSSGDGGGLWFENTPTVNNCTFRNNKAVGLGGGVRFHGYNKAPTFTACVFSNNLAAQGGGFSGRYMKGSLLDCLFIDNTAGIGGGLDIDSFGPFVSKCRFVANQATNSAGGGVYGYKVSSGGVQSCEFVHNQAKTYGGGVYFSYGSSEMPMVGCTFASNKADRGGGLSANRSNMAMTNCIVWGNSAISSRPEIYAYATSAGARNAACDSQRVAGHVSRGVRVSCLSLSADYAD